jgi:hypothetical protein
MSDLVPRRNANKILEVDPPILGFTRLEIVTHAMDMMKLRDIDKDDVILTLRDPSETGLPTQPGRKRYTRSRVGGGKQVDVVFEELEDRIRVITVIGIERRLVNRKRRKP